MNRGQPVVLLLLLFLALGVVAQLVPLYTDWLWFQEVGYTEVFTKTLALRGSLFLGLALAVLVFLYVNLTLAARTAAPDVIWELEDQLGLPGRVVIEPLIRRFLPVVLFAISLVAGLRATVHWETLLRYFNTLEFGRTDPLFGRDLSFFVFVLPFWRLLYGWAITLVVSTIILTLAVYVLQRSLVLTTRGPRLAAGARTHLLSLGALALALRPWASGSTGSSWSSRPAGSCSAPRTPTSTRRYPRSACSRWWAPSPPWRVSRRSRARASASWRSA